MILVTGATGPLGTAVTENLLKDSQELRILVRDTAKVKLKGVQIAVGDYDDDASLLAAMQGIDKVFLVSGNDIEKRGKQHANVIQAALTAGVKHIVYVSLQRKDDSSS